MFDNKTVSGTHLYMISGLLLAFSIYRIVDAKLKPERTIQSIEQSRFAERGHFFPAPPVNSGISTTAQTKPQFISGDKFNIPELLKLSVSDLKEQLKSVGEPQQGLTQSREGVRYNTLLYRKGIQEMTVCFEPGSEYVSSLYVACPHPGGWTMDDLLRWSGLTNDLEMDYMMEVMPAAFPPRYYRGVKVMRCGTPKPSSRISIVPAWNTPAMNEQSLPASFDIPSIVGLDIEGVKKVMGQPQTGMVRSEDVVEDDLIYKRQETQLIVRYDRKTGRVKHMILTSPASHSSSRAQLLVQAHLPSAGMSQNYKIDLIPSEFEHQYYGLKIIPKPI